MSWFNIIKDDEDFDQLTEEQVEELTELFNTIVERVRQREREEMFGPEPEPFIANERLARIMATYLVRLRMEVEEIRSKNLGLETHMFSYYYPELTFRALETIDDLLDELQAANLLEEFQESHDGIIPDVHALMNEIINTVADTDLGAGYIYYDPQELYDSLMRKSSWFDTIKGIDTATRSAELWVLNEEAIYNMAMGFITNSIRGTNTSLEEAIQELAQYLSEIMPTSQGFMDELVDMQPSDGLSDVDWEEVARNFTEEIKEEMEAYR
tara:strand:- start:11200 stop:12006 length:807 start_codon:yes stop_codon:yes gene_type:complete